MSVGKYAPLFVLLLCSPAQADGYDNLRGVLSRMVASNNLEAKRREEVREDGGIFVVQNKKDITVDSSGLITWRQTISTCFQAIYQARLSELDVAEATSEPHSDPKIQDTAFIRIPCKIGKCVVAKGGQVWPAIGGTTKCKPSDVTEHGGKFAAAIPRKFMVELEQAFKQLAK